MKLRVARKVLYNQVKAPYTLTYKAGRKDTWDNAFARIRGEKFQWERIQWSQRWMHASMVGSQLRARAFRVWFRKWKHQLRRPRKRKAVT